MLLYIHIPFCTSKCGYCAFTSLTNRESYFDAYIAALCDDITYTLKDSHYTLQSIFIGGGTPNTLSVHQFEAIFATIAKYATFGKDCEISCEANINLLSKEWCRGIRSLGCNRLSVGVQSFNADKLAYLERTHNVKDIALCMDNANSAGFSNINCDMIIDTPLDNEQLIESELLSALSLPISHISVYSLSIDSGSRFATHKYEARADSMLCFLARDILQDNGFMQYEVSNYALNNAQCKHNMGYWQGEAYLGCGLGAVGRVGTYRYSATSHLTRYLESPLSRDIESLSAYDMCVERIMLGLRCKSGVDMAYLPSLCPSHHSQNPISILLEGGKCHIYENNHQSFLRANELFLSDEIALWLLSRLDCTPTYQCHFAESHL